MQPIYAVLNKNLHTTTDQKKAIVKDILPDFYRRMRVYREKSFEDLSESSKIPVSAFSDFENKSTSLTYAIETSYLHACNGFDERAFFSEQLNEFFNPLIKEGKLELAKAIFKDYGIVLPTVDYKTINSPRGVVLELKR